MFAWPQDVFHNYTRHDGDVWTGRGGGGARVGLYETIRRKVCIW